MKGGVGASYNPNCDLDVIKRIPSIKVRWYDLKKKQMYITTFKSHDQFCKFMKDNDFGIKIFKNEDDHLEEYNKVLKFIKTVNIDVIKDYTCIAAAISEDRIYLGIEGENLMIFSNAHGTLRDAKIMIKLDPIKFFEEVYTTCFDFLTLIHEKNICYGDLKTTNILYNELDTGNVDIIIGDMGSLVFPYDNDSQLKTRYYTFIDPLSPNFVHFWTKGKGSKLALTKRLTQSLFSEKQLIKTVKSWDIIRSYMRVDDQSDSDEDENDVQKLYSDAIDWFHFGIAMIEFVVFTNDERLLKYIDRIWRLFCCRPSIYNEPYDFTMLTCGDTHTDGKKKHSVI
jgi:hypothetical protein